MAESIIIQAGEIFSDALEIESEVERNQYVERMCEGDAELLAMVQELLESKNAADEFFLEGCPTQLTADECAESLSREPAFCEAKEKILPPERKPGQCIGPYRLLEKIGEGGGGRVFLAEQERPVRRQVALKVIRLGADSKNIIARFEAERQVLAMMEHANIAHVLDAGTTDEGLPFFVMELVHGVRITEYCDTNCVDIPHRLELFIQVCLAIQHAHHKGVLHRDIKPSNILITMQDGVPVPKVIDFGIAKAICDPLQTDGTIQTLCEQFVGTPAYMSPEQAGLGGVDVDVRSDIYSLGVLLYELLVGKQPFDRKELMKSGLDTMLRTLREGEPTRPSARLQKMGEEEFSETSHYRQTEPRRLKTMLGGDLDWIVMKALEKDRGRRYQTADGFAEDVRRYLDDEPVVARPPSRRYRFHKLVSRNKGVFASVGAIGLTLIAGLGVSSWLFLREREAVRVQVLLRHEAEQARQNEAVLREEAEVREKITQAYVLLKHDRLAEADKLLEDCQIPVIKPSLEASAVFRRLGLWNVKQGRWPQAADRFWKLAQAYRMDKTDMTDVATRDLLLVAPTLVAAGELSHYRQLVRETIKHFEGTRNPIAAEQVIKISVILPLDETIIEALDPLAGTLEQSVLEHHSASPTHVFLAAWRAFALSCCEYRRGNYETAIAWAERCLDYHAPSPTRIAMTHLVLAMGHHQLGHTEAARTEFELGSRAVNARFPDGLGAIKDLGSSASGTWYDWLNAYLLMQEAEKVLSKIPFSDEQALLER